MAKTLVEWVEYIASLHGKTMELGLDRVRTVADRLGILSVPYVVVTVGGTNGKGSCVAGLEAIYLAQGYRVGAFTSPYLYRLNEEIRIQGNAVADDIFCQAFTLIENARQNISLTPFEFNTLAALITFKQAKLDVVLLEVGLGGRLDAVNIIDADLAVISSIGIDHVDWLGDTRELIAIEKAGIFRPGRPVVCGDDDPPVTLIDAANQLQAPFYCQGRDFFYQMDMTWSWQGDGVKWAHLPLPMLALQNMSTVLMAVQVLQQKLPVQQDAIFAALQTVTLPARMQVIAGDVPIVLDVSHNPAAATWLAKKLALLGCKGRTLAVFSMLRDKDILGTIDVIKDQIDDWHIAELSAERKATIDQLLQAFQQSGVSSVTTWPRIVDAYQHAIQQAKPFDRVVVFGSFYTVACVPTDR